jgi:uncharacterized Fe-S cluster protein YjdI
LTSKHIKAKNGLIIDNKTYVCEKCDINFKHESSYCRHKKKCKIDKNENIILEKDLTIMLVKQNAELMDGLHSAIKKYACEKCHTEFKHHSSYCRHKKNCIIDKNNILDKDLIIMLVKQNTELIEQNTELMDMLKNNTSNTIQNENSLNNNNKITFVN